MMSWKQTKEALRIGSYKHKQNKNGIERKNRKK